MPEKTELSQRLTNSFFKRADGLVHDLWRKFENTPVEVLLDEELEFFRGSDRAPLVLYVGLRYDYARREWGLGFEHHNFLNVLVNMGCSVIYFDYDRLRSKFGNERTSKMLREALLCRAPDYLFYFHYLDWIDHEVWKLASTGMTNTKSIIWLADDHFRYEETKSLWSLFNLVVTTDKAGWERRRSEGFENVHLSQWGCNHFLYRDLGMARIHDVTFVGRAHGSRKEFVSRLHKNGVKVSTFGPGWAGPGRVSQGDLVKILNQSKIALNISAASKGERLQIKGRDFEAPACGCVLLTGDSEELRSFFVPGEEVVTYTDVADAAKKIAWLLGNDQLRKTIAAKGKEKCLRDHTTEKRLRQVFEAADRL